MSSPRLAYASFYSLLSGPTVKVVWGVEGSAAVVPEALLRSCRSPSLDASLKQVWTAGQDAIIDWKEQDGPTIERFVTWLYRGDYNAPSPRPRSSERGPWPNPGYHGKGGQDTNVHGSTAEDSPPAEPAPELALDPPRETEQQVGQHLVPWPQKDSHVMKHVIAETCSGRPLTPISSCLAIGLPSEHQTSEAGIFAQQSFPYASHRYIEVLLAHARLYTFAVYHQIQGLQDASLQRLTQALTRIDCRLSHAASEIAALVQHVYRNTLPSGFSSKDAARRLVSQFAAINFDKLVHGEFETLLEEGGDFVLDVSRKVSRSLRSTQNQAQEYTRQLESEVERLKRY